MGFSNLTNFPESRSSHSNVKLFSRMRFGNQKQGSIRMYPDESLQAFIEPDPWWEPTESIEYGRGRLIKAFLPHVDQNPYIAIPIGRSEPAEHREATVKFVPLDIRQAIRYPNLPVAALPQFPAERWGVYRIKKRPALILGSGGSKVDNNLTAGKAKWQTNRTVIVAPYYGVDEGEKRSGFNPVFVDRIRRCEYPQFFLGQVTDCGKHSRIDPSFRSPTTCRTQPRFNRIHALPSECKSSFASGRMDSLDYKG